MAAYYRASEESGFPEDSQAQQEPAEGLSAWCAQPDQPQVLHVATEVALPQIVPSHIPEARKFSSLPANVGTGDKNAPLIV